MVEVDVVLYGQIGDDAAIHFLGPSWQRRRLAEGSWSFARSFEVISGGWSDFEKAITSLDLSNLRDGHIDFGLYLHENKPMISLRLGKQAMRTLAAAGVSSQVSCYLASGDK